MREETIKENREVSEEENVLNGGITSRLGALVARASNS